MAYPTAISVFLPTSSLLAVLKHVDAWVVILLVHFFRALRTPAAFANFLPLSTLLRSLPSALLGHPISWSNPPLFADPNDHVPFFLAPPKERGRPRRDHRVNTLPTLNCCWLQHLPLPLLMLRLLPRLLLALFLLLISHLHFDLAN